MFCNKCGNQVPDNAEICPSCQSPVSQSPAQKKNKTSVLGTIAALLYIASLVLIVILFLSDSDDMGLIRVTAGCFIFGCVFTVLDRIKK